MAIISPLKKTKNTNFNKELDRIIKERAQIYSCIGLEAVTLHEAGMLNAPELDVYFDKLADLNQEMEALEAEKRKIELQTKGRSTCSCGAAITIMSRFCPECGKTIDSGIITCICGNQIEGEQKFCPKCGSAVQDINAAMMSMGMLQQGMLLQQGMIPQVIPIHASELRMKECVCGAKVPEGLMMCMECGRKIQ